MKKIVLAAAVLAATAFGVAGSTQAGNVSSYDGASWYGKYLAVTSGATPLCSGNTGSVKQPSFGANVDASHECGSQSETFIAINPAQEKNVIAGSNEIQRLPMRAMYSTNGGSSFTGVDLPLPPPRTNNGFDFGSDPGVAFDAQGNAYYSYIVVFFGSGGGINGTSMAVAHSGNGGKDWTATFFAPQTGSGQFNDKPMITVDKTRSPNRVYVTWDNATGNSSSTKNGNDVVISHSDDGGATFSDPVSVSGPFTGKTGGIGADPYVTSNGTLHVAWQDYAHGQISDAASMDGGLTFSAPTRVAAVSGFETLPVAQGTRGALVYPACDSSSSTLYCSYMNDNKVYVATNAGSGWTSKQMPAAGDQFNQWLAVDQSDGSINVAYYDTTTPGAPTTTYTLARSTDGGAHYTTSSIATATTDETTPDANLGNQYGDYEGIAASSGTVRPVWTDRRQDVIDLGLREEVFTATLKP
jgi:hypothetical protein